MDSGEGGCNDNIISAMIFPCPTNGIEVTFSRNILQQPSGRMQLRRLGRIQFWNPDHRQYDLRVPVRRRHRAWAGQRHRPQLFCRRRYRNSTMGARQPARRIGAFPRQDVSSRNYEIQHNYFVDVKIPSRYPNSQGSINDDNQFLTLKKLLVVSENPTPVLSGEE